VNRRGIHVWLKRSTPLGAFPSSSLLGQFRSGVEANAARRLLRKGIEAGDGEYPWQDDGGALLSPAICRRHALGRAT
jgi:hypothetical protein